MYFKFLFIFAILVPSFSNAFEETETHKEESHAPILCTRTLNPAKGTTVWHAPDQELRFSWPSYHNFQILKHHEDTLPGDLESTCSDFTVRSDYGALFEGLHAYNLSKLSLRHTGAAEMFKVSGFDIIGYWSGECVYLFNRSNTPHLETILPTIEKELFLKGARRLYVGLANSQKGLGPLFPVDEKNLEFSEGLQKIGYCALPGSCNFETGDLEQFLTKEIDAFSSSESTSIPLEWGEDPLTPNFSALSESFGVFIRDEQASVLGGVLGDILKNAKIPHAHINLFFINDTIRGTGLGKIIMREVEKYVQSFGLKYILLGTGDHQAPWFYEKLNYKRIQTFQDFCKDREGHSLNHYKYCKELT